MGYKRRVPSPGRQLGHTRALWIILVVYVVILPFSPPVGVRCVEVLGVMSLVSRGDAVLGAKPPPCRGSVSTLVASLMR